MTVLSVLFPAAGGSGGMIIGTRTAYLAGKTATVATETPWIPPAAGWTLWGFRVISIGAGGGAASFPGGGGNRIEQIVSLEEMASPSTVVITVGAGANNVAGGVSSFGGWVISLGGFSGGGGVSPHPQERWDEVFREGLGGEGYPGSSSSGQGAAAVRGLRGGGGGAANQSSLSSAGVGGRSYPRTPLLQITNINGSNTATPYRGSSSGARQNGVGDWCGDGGDGAVTGAGQNGYFPGGGAGSSCDGTQSRGGHGVVIVYPIFKKV